MKLSTINKILGILVISILAVTLVSGFLIYASTDRVNRSYEYENKMISLGNNMENSSEFLTDKARSFAVTYKNEDLKLYWEEVNAHIKKENTFDALARIGLSFDEKMLLMEAQEDLALLMKSEALAMKFITDALSGRDYDIPVEVSRIILSEQQKNYPVQNKLELARNLVFGNEYREKKIKLANAIRQFRGKTQERTMIDIQRSKELAKKALSVLTLSIVLIFILAIMVTIIQYKLLSVPIKKYIKVLKASSPEEYPKLVPMGTHEMRALAIAFNKMHDNIIEFEKALKDSQTRMKLHLQLMPIAAIESTNDFDIISWNPASEKTYGFEPSEAIGRNIFELLIPEEKREEFRKSIVDAYAKENFTPDIVENITKHGKKIISEWYNTKLLDSDGNELGWTTIAMDITVEQKEAERILYLSQRDPLTGLYNRRYIYERMVEAKKRSKRANSVLSVIMIDIDCFKFFNDQYGHESGDLVIKHIAQVMQETTRETDCVSRWGGEEFLILLPDTDLTGAYNLAERIRRAVEVEPIRYNDTLLNVTITAGVATCGERTIDECVKAADLAMLDGKAKGKNRVSKGE